MTRIRLVRRAPVPTAPASTTLVTLAVLLAGCGEQPGDRPGPDPRPETGAAWFVESAGASGIDFVHRSGHDGTAMLMPEIMGGGASLFDADGDGDLDLYCVQSGSLHRPGTAAGANRLYRNRGDGTFEDVTDAAGVGDRGYGMGSTVGDIDGDGDLDLYVTNVGPNVLFRNDGDGTFTDVTAEAGVGDPGWGASAAFADLDGDGLPELFVTNYVRWSAVREIACTSRKGFPDYCSPKSYQAPASDTLYRNRGDGSFEDVSSAAGIDLAYGNGLGVTCADFDEDGRLDVYVANDGTPNQLWMNRGDGTFTDEAVLRGCAVNAHGMSEAGMGVAPLDIGTDGHVDLFMSHLDGESNTFYRNDGGYFSDASAMVGLGGPSRPFTGFGLGFADFDQDGHLDVFIANGRVGRNDDVPAGADPYAETNQVFRGVADGRFEEVRPRGGLPDAPVATSRGAAFGDVDGDGDVDIVVVNRDDPVHLFRNVASDERGWLRVRVLDSGGTDAIGAVVRCEAGGRVQSRVVQIASSYCASNDPHVHFGLADAESVDELVVRWPDGSSERFEAVAPNGVRVLRHGAGTMIVAE